MADDKTTNAINNVLNYSGNSIPEFIELLKSISDYLFLIDSDDCNYFQMVEDLRLYLKYGRREYYRSEITCAIDQVRNLVARQ